MSWLGGLTTATPVETGTCDNEWTFHDTMLYAASQPLGLAKQAEADLPLTRILPTGTNKLEYPFWFSKSCIVAPQILQSIAI